MAEVSTPPSNPRTIVLRGNLSERHMEGYASTTVYPGMLVEKKTTGVEPYGQWGPHATAGGYAEKVIAVEGYVADIPQASTFNGGTVDDAYASGDLMMMHHCEPGDEVWVWLVASGTAVTNADFLTSNGNGDLKKATSTDQRLFKVLESVTPGSSRTRCRARAL